MPYLSAMISGVCASLFLGLLLVSFWTLRKRHSTYLVAFSMHLKYKGNFHLRYLCAVSDDRLFNTPFNALSFAETLPGNCQSSHGIPSHPGTAEPLPGWGWKCSKWTCSNFGQIRMRSVWGETLYTFITQKWIFKAFYRVKWVAED